MSSPATSRAWTPGAVIGHEFVGDVDRRRRRREPDQGRRPCRRLRLHGLRPLPLVRERRSLGVPGSRLLWNGRVVRARAFRRAGRDRARAFRRYDARQDSRGCQRRSGHPGQRQSRNGWAAIERARLEPGEMRRRHRRRRCRAACKPRRAGRPAPARCRRHRTQRGPTRASLAPTARCRPIRSEARDADRAS